MRQHHGKIVLLDWLLPGVEVCSMDLVIHYPLVLANTLVELARKSRVPDKSCDLMENNKEQEDSIKALTSNIKNNEILWSSIENHLILCSFDNDTLEKETEAAPKNIKEKQKCRISFIMKEKLVDLLKRNSGQQEDKLLMPLSESEQMSAVLGMVSNVSLLAGVLSCMVRQGIITLEELPDHSLSDTICSQLLRVSSFVTPLIRKHHSSAYKVVSRLRSLLDLSLQEQVLQFVRQSLPVDIIEATCMLLPRQRILRTEQEATFLDGERFVGADGSVSGSDGGHDNGDERLESTKMLKSYICGYGSGVGGQQSRFLSQILDLMASREFNYKEECDFTMAEEMLNGIVKLETISREVIHQVLKVLQAMCVARYQECHVASSLLTIVKGLVRHVSAWGSDASKLNTIIIMEGFRTGIKRKKYGILAYSKFLSCIAEFLKVDPLGIWSKWNESNKTLGEDILSHMTSPFHEIRMDCAQYVKLMFSNTVDERALQRQKQLFEDVCSEVMASFAVDDDLSPREMADEGVNRTASALHTVTSLIVAGPAVHRKALFFFLELIHKKNINLGLAAKVLRLIGSYFKLKDATELLKLQLKYCIHHWLKEGYQVQNFPHNVIGCTSLLQFYNQHKSVLVPAVLQYEDEAALNELAQRVDGTVSDIVKECFPEMEACLLPCLAVKDSNDHCGITETELNIAQRLHSHLQRIIGQAEINDLITSRISEVIVGVMGVLHDPDHLAELCGFRAVLPEPCPPVFRAQVVLKVLQHLQASSPQPEVPLVLMLSQIVPNQVHKILLSLVTRIYQAPTQEDKLLAFHCYAAFVDAMATQLAEPLGLDSMTVFVVRDVCHTLMHLVACDGIPLIAKVACHFFQRFCRKCLPARGNVLSELLCVIVSCFVPIIGQEFSPLKKHAQALLHCLVVDNEVCLKGAIAQLDPFPDGTEFEALQEVYQRLKYATSPFSLKDEIQHFLNVGHSDLTGRVEGLKYLRQQLSKRKEDLCDLYEQLQTLRGFSEDCANSIVHRLVAMLVDLTLGTDEQVSIEASRCLGELGPADLTTMILKPEHSRITNTDQTNSLEVLLGFSLEMLTGYLTDSNFSLVCVSSDALYSILNTTEGRLAAEEQIKYMGKLKKMHMTPFLHGNINGACGTDVNEVLVKRGVDHTYLWASGEVMNHDTWITRLVCALLVAFGENNVFRQLCLVCQEKASFCERLLPLLIDMLLCSGGDVCHTIISSNMRKFFQKHCEEHAALCDMSIGPLMRKRCAEQIVLNKASVQCMLNVVQYIRMQGASRDNTVQSLDLDCLHVAQAAQFCSAHFTSILYAELCCAQQINDDPVVGNEANVTVLDYIYEKNSEKGAVIQRILREAYTKLNYGDAVFGCGSCQLLEPATRVHHLELEGKWERAAHEYELLLMKGNKVAKRGLALALCRLGSYHLLSYLSANRDEHTTDVSTGLTDLQYECSWRLKQWHLEPCSEDVYEGHQYAALQAMVEGDTVAVGIAEKQARHCVVKELTQVSLESVKNIYPILSHLQALQELKDFEAVSLDRLESVLETWNQQDKLRPSEFEFIEPILSQRATLLSVACDKMEGEAKNKFLNVFVESQLKTAALACKEKWLQVSSACLNSLTSVADMSWEHVVRLKLEEAQILWLQGNTEMATCMLRTLISKFQREPLDLSTKHDILWATALRLYGNWLVETKSENPQVIIKENFLSALALVEDFDSTSDVMTVRLETCAALARLADFQYQHLTRYIASPEFEAKQKGITESVQMAEQLQRETHTDKKQAYARLMKQSSIDKLEIANVLKEKDMYLSLAVKHYCLSLEYGDKHNLLVSRILSLWLQNSEHTEVIKVIGDRLPHIPNYKFLLLLPQLAARISNDVDNPFVITVHRLLERCAVDHPHHTLSVLLAISNLHLDQKYNDAPNARTPTKTSKEPRVLGAQHLVHRLSSVESVAPILDQMKKMFETLVSLAYHKTPSNSVAGKLYPVPDIVKKIRNFDLVSVPSVSVPVMKNGCYEDIIGIKCFDKTFTTVGGVNVPKKIFCIGTDGVKRPLLVKGKDDLRQDAVMQQVFTIMNALLKSNKETKKRKLLIRTYKVACKSSNEERLNVYREICKNLRPAFHHFFLENFRTPATWFERRQAYIHSVATSSMVGYILGLGDRHVVNILIDVTTAEIIHIDFGIAFEQGKILPTPETVPFRLTRDIVDGMGVSGIEGVFRRSCEKTMSVLRENQETIHTILEVFLYDPLYAWTVTPAKASDIQNKWSSMKPDDTIVVSSEVNMQAERALLRLQQKLNGTEDVMVTSVAGQVNRLLQQARDPALLSRLFHGWQAYL